MEKVKVKVTDELTGFPSHVQIGVLVSLLLVLITFLYFFFGKSKRGRSILFVGPSESGKTSVFVHLTAGKVVDTVTSTVPNEAEYKGNGVRAPLVLKDLPGHDRVRNKYWEANRSGMRGVVCVVDAAGGSKAVREAAEVLYSVLTDSYVNSVKPNILIFANKQDQPTAKGVKILRTLIEREMTTLRLTKSASLQTTGGNTTSSRTLGKMDRDFDFDHMAPIRVEFAEGTGKADNIELTPLVKWLENVA